MKNLGLKTYLDLCRVLEARASMEETSKMRTSSVSTMAISFSTVSHSDVNCYGSLI